MAIVKGNYTRSRQKAKTTIRYITHRPARTGKRAARELFNDNGAVSLEEAYEMINNAPPGTVFFRIVISPSKYEDQGHNLDLRMLTRQTLLTLTERLGIKVQFLAAAHDDHTDLRHIHALVMVRLPHGVKVGRQDYKALREQATHLALFQKRAYDLVTRYQLEEGYQQSMTGVIGGKASVGYIHLHDQLCSECEDNKCKGLHAGQGQACGICGHKGRQAYQQLSL